MGVGEDEEDEVDDEEAEEEEESGDEARAEDGAGVENGRIRKTYVVPALRLLTLMRVAAVFTVE